MEDIKIIIPEEKYQIIEFNQNELPGIAVVNSNLKDENLNRRNIYFVNILLKF